MMLNNTQHLEDTLNNTHTHHTHLQRPFLLRLPALQAQVDDYGEVWPLIALNEGLLVHLRVADALHVVVDSVLAAGTLVEVEARPTQFSLQLLRYRTTQKNSSLRSWEGGRWTYLALLCL